MLLKMLAEQVSSQWDIVSQAVRSAFPDGISDHDMNKVLALILSGDMQCWVITGNNHDDIYGLAITNIGEYLGTGKVLVIMSVYGYKPIPFKLWEESFRSLGKWAKSMDCDGIVAQTKNPAIIKLVRRLGGDISSVLVKLPISSNGRK